MKRILPTWLYDKISENFLLDKISEIRIRLNKPIVVCYDGKYQTLCQKNSYAYYAEIAEEDLISYIISVATKQSFYAYNNQIKHGFITTDSGIRIGICGTVVMNEDKVSTIKNITSLNIRIARNIEGCAKPILDLICYSNLVKNTLVISPPGAGKTTFIRDLAIQLSEQKHINNILIVDERNEITGSAGNEKLINAKNIDIILGGEKHYAFKEAIKSMNPSVIVTDEISEYSDFEEIMEAARCGVKIVATAHAESIEELKKKPSFKKITEHKIFNRVVVLSKRKGLGTIEAVFDENFRAIYVPFNVI